MLRPTGQFILITTVCCISLVSILGCSSLEDSDSTDQEVEIKAQTVSTVTPTPTPKPTSTPTPLPTATNLPTELIESISPISPISPVTTTKEIDMSLADGSVEPPPGSEELLAAAVADLSAQTGTSIDQIKLISIEPVEWSDSSLGCPQEGFMYAQVITPGYQIVLEAQGQEYTYHTNQTTNVILCQQ